MINILKAVYFLSINDSSYREVANLNEVLKSFVFEVNKDIKENNIPMNINIENDVFKNKINASSSQINVMKSNRNELILSQSQNHFAVNNNQNNNINLNNNITNINNINNINNPQLNKNMNYQNNNHININHINNE